MRTLHVLPIAATIVLGATGRLVEAATIGPASPGAAASLTFGSASILHACWTSEQLHGTAAETRGGVPVKESSQERNEMPAVVSDTPVLTAPSGSIRGVRLAEPLKALALTFDLCESSGESSGYDGAVIDALRQLNVPATFFAGGKWMRSHSERTMQLMADPLFEIGNHSWTHKNFRLLDQKSILDQLRRPQLEYQRIRHVLSERPCVQSAGVDELAKIPDIPHLFRFPYGTCSSGALADVAQVGLTAIQWDIVTGDPSPAQTSAGIVRHVLASARAGSIIVLHANGRGHGTAQAIPVIVDALRQKGFAFLTVSQLLARGDPMSVDSCYEERPGDNRRYDHIAARRSHQ